MNPAQRGLCMVRRIKYAKFTPFKQGTSAAKTDFLLIMLKKQPKPLSELVGEPGSVLSRLAREANRRISLADDLRQNLKDELGDSFSHCNLRDDGTLVLVTTSPEWAARLRFESATILEICRRREPGVLNVKVRVSDLRNP
jgi:hypothetical protein